MEYLLKLIRERSERKKIIESSFQLNEKSYTDSKFSRNLTRFKGFLYHYKLERLKHLPQVTTLKANITIFGYSIGRKPQKLDFCKKNAA